MLALGRAGRGRGVHEVVPIHPQEMLDDFDPIGLLAWDPPAAK